MNQIDTDKLKWGTVSIYEELGELCRSHGCATKQILANEKIRTSYLADADLRFCAVLLRLADILDFDHSRSPEAVYKYLGLSRRDTPSKKASDVEWRQHLSAEGFLFPTNPSGPYPLHCMPGPHHPCTA